MSLWKIEHGTYNKFENKKYETIFTLANGYRGLRGAIDFSNDGVKGNFLAGVFDKSSAQVTEIVNLQDPLGFNIYVEDEKIDIEQCSIEKYKRTLDMKKGILSSEFILITRKGRKISINTERFVSRNNVHRWAERYEITPLNFQGKIFIENFIDGSTTNSCEDPMNKARHYRVEKLFDFKPGIALLSETFERKIAVIEASRIIGENSKGNIFKARRYAEFGEKAAETYECFGKKGETINIYKLGITYSSRDIEEKLEYIAMNELNLFTQNGYEKEKELHIKVWEKLWNDIDIEIDGDERAQKGIRFNLFHLASSAYDGDDKVSIAAKALHGEGYKGHVFWDTEIFMLPFFVYTEPEVAKNLLLYRYHTLDGARENAKITGFKGARFPWESADDGMEVTPRWGFDYDGNPVRIWTGDEEYHINSDIVFGIVEYFRATEDKEFLVKYGLEIMLDTTKFWQSRVEYNEKKDRYEISRVIGPDEFHEHVDNNVFTNYLAKWSIKKTLDMVEWIKEEDINVLNRLCNKLCINEEDFTQWKNICEKIYIPTSKDGTIIEQFEGYFDLADISIVEHDENGMPVWPDMKGYKLGETQLIKQADVVQLMIMLGEEFSYDMKKENYHYYEERTMHKSSLSPSMYSILGLAVDDKTNAYKYFMKTVYTDLEDNQGNTDFGLHAASTGGSWQSAVLGFAGLSVDKGGVLNLKPWIPEHWKSMKLNIKWKKSKVILNITQDFVNIQSEKCIDVKVYNREYRLEKDIVTKISRK